jgi:hypothetical protein
LLSRNALTSFSVGEGIFCVGTNDGVIYYSTSLGKDVTTKKIFGEAVTDIAIDSEGSMLGWYDFPLRPLIIILILFL